MKIQTIFVFMKTMIRSAVLFLFCIAISMVYGGVPPMSVSVSDASGNAAYKGATNSTGGFATAKLKPGNYVVQLNAKSPAVKGKQYAIVVSAGKTKVSATAVPGEKFTGGGVALKIEVGAGLQITGQVADAQSATTKSDPNVKIINGKRYVWIGPEIGSNLPGRWVEEGSADAASARNRRTMSKDEVDKIQSHEPPTMTSSGGIGR